MTPQQLKYFDDMEPGQILSTDKVQNPANFIAAAKQYIDQFGTLVLNPDHTTVTKLNPFPKDGSIAFFLT